MEKIGTGVSSFVAVRPTPGCPGFRYDSRSSYLANKVFSQSTVLGFTTRKKSGSLRFLVQLNPFSDFTQEIASFGLSSRNWIFLSLPAGLRKLKRRTSAGCFSSAHRHNFGPGTLHELAGAVLRKRGPARTIVAPPRWQVSCRTWGNLCAASGAPLSHSLLRICM